MLAATPGSTPGFAPLPPPAMAAAAAANVIAASNAASKEAGWRPPAPLVDEPEVWSSAQAYRVAESLRIAAMDPTFTGRFRRNHVSDLADDVTAYAVTVEVAQSKPEWPPVRRVDFSRYFHRVASRVRSVLGAAEYAATVVNEVRCRLQSVPGIPSPGEPMATPARSMRTPRGRFKGKAPPTWQTRRSSSASTADTYAPGRGGRGFRGGFGGRRGGGGGR